MFIAAYENERPLIPNAINQFRDIISCEIYHQFIRFALIIN